MARHDDARLSFGANGTDREHFRASDRALSVAVKTGSVAAKLEVTRGLGAGAAMAKAPKQRNAPDGFVVATFNQAMTAHRAGDLVRAEQLYRLVLSNDPRQFDAMHMLGVVAGQRGDFREGARILAEALKVKPDSADGLINLGRMQAALADYAAAGESYRKALALNPNHPLAHNNYGIILRRLGHAEDAISHCDKAIALAPNYGEAWNNRGNALFDLGRHDEALESYTRALSLAPGLAEAMLGRGNVMLAQERYEEALANYDKALAAKPNSADCLAGRGFALRALKRFAPAAESFERALALDPANADAWLGRATVLMELRRFGEAAASFDKVLAGRPDFAEAYYGRGRALQALRRYDDALADFDTALAMQPFFAECLYASGNLLREQNRLEEAAQAFERLYDFAPDHDFLKGMLLYTKMFCGDWDRYAELADTVTWDVQMGQKATEPFVYQAVSSSPADLKRCAEIFSAARYPAAATPIWTGERYAHDKIRVGYVAGEFRYQATSILIAELFERHDKDRFALYAFDNGWDDGSALRKRIAAACDEVVDIASLGDVAAAGAIRQREIDVLVDLSGYFGLERTGVFALRPAPVQVNYLGFPGTIGADYIDYIIADQVVIPAERGRVLHREDRLASRLLPGERHPAAHRRPRADAPGAGIAGAGLRVLLLQQHLQDHAGRVRRVDAAARPGRRQRAVAAPAHRARAAQSAPRGGAPRHRAGAAGVRVGHPAGGASRAAPPRRSLPRHAALQCAHHRKRRVVGGPAAAHLRRHDLSGPRRREPAACGGRP